MKFDGELQLGTGLYDLRARSYDPTSARFLQLDPASASIYQPASSSYAFVSDAPLTFKDSSGLWRTPSSDARALEAYTTSFGFQFHYKSPRPVAVIATSNKYGYVITFTYTTGEATVGQPTVTLDSDGSLTFTAGGLTLRDRRFYRAVEDLIRPIQANPYAKPSDSLPAFDPGFQTSSGVTIYGNNFQVSYQAEVIPPVFTIEATVIHKTTPISESGYGILSESHWYPKPTGTRECNIYRCILVPVAAYLLARYALPQTATYLYRQNYFGVRFPEEAYPEGGIWAGEGRPGGK